MSRRVAFLGLAAASLLMMSGVAVAAPPVAIHGATVVAPEGWTPEANSILAKFSGTGEAAGELAEVSTVPGIEAADAAAFFIAAEAWKGADFARFTTKSVHYNDTRFKGADCVKYDGVFKDPSAGGDKPDIQLVGYLCRHPQSPALAIDISFSRRADDAAMPAASVDRGEAFFDSLTFTVPPPGQEG